MKVVLLAGFALALAAAHSLPVTAANPVLAVDAKTEGKQVKLIASINGSIADQSLQKKAPEAGHLADVKAWETLRKAWKLDIDEAKKINSEKHLVLVGTTRGGQINGTPTLDEKGDLKFAPISTRDLRPGFRYLIVAVSREGVKSVNGKPLK